MKIFNENVGLMLFCLLWTTILLEDVNAKTQMKRVIMDNINSGIKFAGQMLVKLHEHSGFFYSLGVNTAADVAELVAKAFSSPNLVEKQDTINRAPQKQHTSNTFNPVDFISGILRLIGFDNGKLGALAINGIIFIAQMIGNALITRPRPPLTAQNYEHANDENQPRMEKAFSDRKPRDGLPIDWMLSNPSEEISKLLLDVQDSKLPEYLAEVVQRLENLEGEGDCVKLLLCKTAPFVWSMQKSLLQRLNGDITADEEAHEPERLANFFKYLPSVEKFKNHGHMCEERYSSCNVSNTQ